MIRSIMQVYVKGSIEAVALYQRAFDAKLLDAYTNEDGSYYHSELDVFGQVLAVAEASFSGAFANEERTTGNVMQFCLHFKADEAYRVEQAYEALREGSQILTPLGPCDYSPYMVDLIDRFGIRWCIFVGD